MKQIAAFVFLLGLPFSAVTSELLSEAMAAFEACVEDQKQSRITEVDAAMKSCEHTLSKLLEVLPADERAKISQATRAAAQSNLADKQ